MRRKLIKSEKGQALVEMALVLPILIFLLLAIMEGGRIFAGYVELQNAARDGTRYASIRMNDYITAKTSPDVIETYIQNRLNMLDDTKLQFQLLNPTWDPINLTYNVSADPALADVVEIELSYPLEITTPLISDITGNPFNLDVKMSMRKE